MKTIAFAFAIVAATMIPAAVEACSCAPQPDNAIEGVTQAFESADVVFLGTVEDVSKPANDVPVEETTFYVVRSWKGERMSRIITRINVQCCVCGMSFEVGETYLVYGYDRDGDGILSTSICTRTALEAEAQEDLEILDHIVAGNGA